MNLIFNSLPRDLVEFIIVMNYCVQFGQNGVVGDEDCLNLNIIRPLEAEEPLPILFFTHGGSSTNGSGHQDIYIGNPQLATDAIAESLHLGFYDFDDHLADVTKNPLNPDATARLRNLCAERAR